MCGIAGIYRPEGAEPALVREMVRRLVHRGPDEEGVHVCDDGGTPWAVLGARRLAITDPAGGHQPVASPDGRLVVAMNGEVYNHRRLRQECEAWDAEFQSQGDTEVAAAVLSAVLPPVPTAVGIDRGLERLHGMFALAVVEPAQRRLWLVRDRMGQKPLYWAEIPGGIAWASEVHALRAVPGVGQHISGDAVSAYLLTEYVPAPLSIWEGVHKLEPGCLLEVTADGVQQRRWWTPPLPQPGDFGNEGKWAQSLRGSLQVATFARLEADVPVGVLLSGGLDSSGVASLAQQRRSRDGGPPLQSFSVSVQAPGFDEGGHARTVAAAIGTEHHDLPLTAALLPELLDDIAARCTEPLADSSLPATWLLSRSVAQAGLKCVLSGDGADESFAGYPTALAHKLAAGMGPLQGLAGRMIGRAARRLPVGEAGVTRDYMARRFALGLGLPWGRRHQVWMGAWTPAELHRLQVIGGPRLSDAALWRLVDPHAAAAADTDAVGRALYLDQRLYLAEGVLTKVDRASMAFGVEVRSPFLEHTLVELAAAMPSDMKLRGRTPKHILRVALAEDLPAATLARKKQGFGTPVGPWLRGPRRDLLDGLCERVEGLLAPEPLRQCMAEHLDGSHDHRRRLWSAVILGRWREMHGG